ISRRADPFDRSAESQAVTENPRERPRQLVHPVAERAEDRRSAAFSHPGEQAAVLGLRPRELGQAGFGLQLFRIAREDAGDERIEQVAIGLFAEPPACEIREGLGLAVLGSPADPRLPQQAELAAPGEEGRAEEPDRARRQRLELAVLLDEAE